MADTPLRTSEPLVDLLPVQPPVAVQDVAPVAVQVSVVDPPLATVVGAAPSVIEGAAGLTTATFTDCVADPPAPVQVSAKAESAVSAPVDDVPEVGFEPDQLPEAVQDVASVDDQVRVAEEPDATLDGATVSVTVGAAGAIGGRTTPATTVCVAVPPAPEQVSVYEVDDCNEPVDSTPLMVLLPLHPPEATQLEAPVEFQVRSAALASWTVSGATASETVGAGCGVVVGGAAAGVSPPPPHPARLASARNRKANRG